MVFEKEYIMRCSSVERIARNRCCLEMMPSWCRQVKLRKLWDSLSELRGSACERRLVRTVLRSALLPAKTAQFTQFSCQV